MSFGVKAGLAENIIGAAVRCECQLKSLSAQGGEATSSNLNRDEDLSVQCLSCRNIVFVARRWNVSAVA